MGQSSGKQAKTELSKSESTLHFETGKKTPGDFVLPSGSTTSVKTDAEQKPPLVPVLSEDEELTCPLDRRTVPTVFHWEYGGKEVYVSGSFNDWKTRIPLTYSGGEFATIIELQEGEHQYKFLVDGHWIHDPNVITANDTFGGRNNVVSVKKTDFDAADALQSDAGEKAGSFGSLRQASPTGSYGQMIPSPHCPVIVQDGLHSSVPPILPPHLLNVILNKDAVDEEDPTLLPVPNHVALNHLYALSIKDAVMTLSGTHRYRRKYVTTLFYKPIK